MKFTELSLKKQVVNKAQQNPDAPFLPQTSQPGRRWRHWHDPRVSCTRLEVKDGHERLFRVN